MLEVGSVPTISESSDCCATACVLLPAAGTAMAGVAAVLAPACAIELYKPAASYDCVLLDAVPSVATIPAVVDKSLACWASPGSLLATTGEAPLPVLTVGEY